DQTVQITLKQPAPHFLFQLTTAPARIIAAQFGGDDFTVTSGAYFVDAQTDNLLTLVPNDNYWQKAGVEKIELFFRQSSEEAFAAYQSGEVDVMGSLQSAMPVQGLGDPDLNRTEASSGLRYLGFNHARFPFSNAAVRRAFGLAIDRAKLVSQFANLGQVAQRIVPPSLPSGALNFDLPFDPDQAIALLEEVGFQEMGAGEIPLHFALEGNNAAVIEVIQAMLQEMLDNWAAQVGVDAPKIVPQGLPLRPFSQQLNQLRINQGDMDMMLYYSFWGGDYPNLQNWLSQQLRTGRGNNNGQYSSDKFDSNADQADVTSNANSRRRLYQQAEQVALGEDMAWVPLFNTPAAALIRPNVSGLVMTPQGIVIPDYTKLKVTV
ncbi:MAG: hypothetical protein K8J31_21145, partial [Anaerolineae bacterium]|nr:hypothetical protein [Anaerolineae bacterium]